MFQAEEKINTTIKKIEEVKNSNFDKRNMDSLWMSYISENRNFCDVMFALAKHEENSDNIKFHNKLEKTAQALNLTTTTLTPFLLKYLILWTEHNKSFNKHLSKLSQLIVDGKLEEETNIIDVARGKTKSSKNRFCLNNEKKLLISNSLKKLNISNKTDYIKFLNELRLIISDENFNNLITDIEQSIEDYNEELMHTVDGKKEYVFKDDEIVGTSKIKFNDNAIKVINANKYQFNIFIHSLDIKFTNIVTKFDGEILSYKLLAQAPELEKIEI